MEDVVDQWINRPLAACIVKRIIHTPITPNQVTAVSFLGGMVAAWLFTRDFALAPVLGALLLQGSIVVDCVDGQLARAKSMTSDWGDIFDHTSDDVTFLAIAAALAGRLLEHGLAPGATVPLALGGFCMALLLTTSQYFYTAEYHGMTAGQGSGQVARRAASVRAALLARPRGWRHIAARALLAYYLWRLHVIQWCVAVTNPYRRMTPAKARRPESGSVETYWHLHKTALFLWRFCGMSSLAFLLMLACFAGLFAAYLRGLTFGGAGFFAVAILVQRRADQQSAQVGLL